MNSTLWSICTIEYKSTIKLNLLLKKYKNLYECHKHAEQKKVETKVHTLLFHLYEVWELANRYMLMEFRVECVSGIVDSFAQQHP